MQNLSKEADKLDLDYARYVHGDFHPGNVFFNPEGSPPITLIDLDMFSDSYAKTAGFAPTGSGSYDLVYFKIGVALMGLQNGMSGEGIKKIQESFEQEYLAKMDISKDESAVFEKEKKFMEAYVCVKYLSGLIAASKNPDHPWTRTLGVQKIHGLIKFLNGQLGSFALK